MLSKNTSFPNRNVYGGCGCKKIDDGEQIGPRFFFRIHPFPSKNTIARRVDWVFVTAVALASVAALAGLALALKLKAGWLDVFGTGNHWYPARTWLAGLEITLIIGDSNGKIIYK